MTREEQIKQKAYELGQKYFADANNIFARENIEAKYVEHAFIEGIKWADENPSSRCYTKAQLMEMGFAFTTNEDIVTPTDMENMVEKYFEYRKKELCRELYKWIKAKVDANYTATDILRDFEWSFHEVMEE